jgi:DeoR/GlpR family transcriptional regulator of sugar metabolism
MQQLSIERQDQIENFIRENRRATVGELSQYFKVSEPTIRRDLDKLVSTGKVRRAHGGAVALEKVTPEPPILQRMHDSAQEKSRIGAAAAQLVNDGETIFLGSGTTTLEVARNLEGKNNLTVITNSLSIAGLLANYENITIIVTGGVLQRFENSLEGHLVAHTLKELRADKVIVSLRSISPAEGLTRDSSLETMIDRAVLQFARRVILVADHTKFDKTSPVLVAPVTAVHTIVTDDKVSAGTVSELRNRGIEVIQA